MNNSIEKIKIFCGQESADGGHCNLEQEINKWLEKNPDIEIRDRKVSCDGFHAVIAIFYLP